jgi:hypothetical protein
VRRSYGIVEVILGLGAAFYLILVAMDYVEQSVWTTVLLGALGAYNLAIFFVGLYRRRHVRSKSALNG